ncbi:MAG: diguanylate cyclase [Pseudomonadota bacterium]
MAKKFTLAEKYALIFSALIGCSLLFGGLLEIYFSYQVNQKGLVQLQQEKAEAAAARIGQYLFDIEQKLTLTAVPRPGIPALEVRSAEIQLLRRTAAIREIALLDARGQEVLRVSRRAADVVRSRRDFSDTEFFNRAKSGRPYRSGITFRDGTPSMTLAMAVGPEEAGITVAEVDLEFLLDGISRIKVGAAGHAYAVDARGTLIAHPDLGLVLKETSLTALPQVQAAIKGSPPASQELVKAHDLQGAPVLTAFSAIPQLGWFVFVEEPLAAAYRPLLSQAWRSAALALAGIVFTVLTSLVLVRRMLKPIQALREGAALIGRGALDHRIVVKTGDEIEELAKGFNCMAAQLQDSYATLEQKVTERTRELEASNLQLAALSTTDALTGIANRRRFDEVLATEWSRAIRTGQPLALGLLDIDWFKQYNDHHGHQAGDDCLREVARVFAANVCRSGDMVARYGGEEFVFIAPETSAEAALQMANRVCVALSALAIPHADSEFGHITVSIGVASMVPSTDNSGEALLRAADQCMYRAKKLGRNQAVQA